MLIMERNNKKAFLGYGWEDVRLKIPSGKYRLVMLDFWDYTAEVLGDFNSLDEAKAHLKSLTYFYDDEQDRYTDFIIYNDQDI